MLRRFGTMHECDIGLYRRMDKRTVRRTKLPQRRWSFL